MGARDPLRVSSDLELPGVELQVAYSRSGGPGGQNVNKVETCVLLRFSLARSRSLDAEEKARIRSALGSRVTGGDEIVVRADQYRERTRNEEAARARLAALLRRALAPQKARRATRPSRGAIERRLRTKRRLSDRKRARRGEDS